MVSVEVVEVRGAGWWSGAMRTMQFIGVYSCIYLRVKTVHMSLANASAKAKDRKTKDERPKDPEQHSNTATQMPSSPLSRCPTVPPSATHATNHQGTQASERTNTSKEQPGASYMLCSQMFILQFKYSILSSTHTKPSVLVEQSGNHPQH
jgi:hypothetical protein